ncbi:MAG: hypothetical protein WCW40_12050 [Bacteroidota bacterium]
MGYRSLALLLFVFSFSAVAGEKKLSGNFRWDVLHVQQDTVTAEASVVVQSPAKENPFMNGLYSLLLPGVGQYRTERYTKAAIFFGAEVALIVYAVISDHNGNTKTDEFERYAEAHWSAERYAKWINTHGTADYGPTATIDLNKVGAHDFSEINAWESASGPNKVGFSHMLPRYQDQQYYELIGKYYQFKFGWDTYPMDVNGVPLSDGRDYFNNFTADHQIKSYAAERGKANDYYYAASFAVSALVINHVISAFDGYYSTNKYNKEVTASIDVTPVDGIEGKRLLSQVKVSVEF